MTIEEQSTARAIQTIAKHLDGQRINWEQRRFELAKEIYVHRLTLDQERLCLTEQGDMEIAIELADSFIEQYKNTPAK